MPNTDSAGNTPASAISTTPARVARRGSSRSLRRIAAALALAIPLLFAVSTAEATEDISCSVQRTSGGLLLRWTSVPGADQYQYKLAVSGQGNRYRRVSGNEAVIPLEEGVRGSVSLAPIFSDGSTQRRVKCGSQTASAFTCSVVGTDSGVFLSWSAVDGAIEYRYRLSSEGVNRFGTVSGTSAVIDTDATGAIEVGITAVMADGSVEPRTNCGMTMVDNGTPVIVPVDGVRTCTVTSTYGGVNINWDGVEGAVSYQYKLSVPGEGNRYRRVNDYSTFIELPVGTSATVGVNPIFADGSTLRRAACGTATAG